MARSRKKAGSSPVDWPVLLYALRIRWGTPGKPLSQTQAALRVGVTLRSWIGWEQGDQLPALPVRKLLTLLYQHPDLSPPDLK